MADRLKPMTKAWHDRQRRHRHNGFSGSVKMMQMQLQGIIESDSTSAATKYIAGQMLKTSYLLAEGLKTRIDQ